MKINNNSTEKNPTQRKRGRQFVQPTITGEPLDLLPPAPKRRRITRLYEHQNHFNQPILSQSNLHEEDLAAKDSEAFGDDYPPQPGKNCTLITFQNIGPQRFLLFDHNPSETSKAFKKSQAGIALYAECSLAESLLVPGKSFNTRMKVDSPHSFSKLTNNINELKTTSCYQPGGVAFTLQNNTRAHQAAYGYDKTGLGRWIWNRLRGKDTTFITIVSAYRPCNNKGISTVWSQQCRYFRDENQIKTPNPIEIFNNDLITELKKWILRGDNIIIGINMNDDVRKNNLTKQFLANDLRDAILTTHPSKSPP